MLEVVKMRLQQSQQQRLQKKAQTRKASRILAPASSSSESSRLYPHVKLAMHLARHEPTSSLQPSYRGGNLAPYSLAATPSNCFSALKISCVAI